MQSLSSYSNQSWLSWFLRGVLIFLFLILVGKLFEVQIIKGDYYRNLSEENRVRHIPIPAPRGRILAKEGEALADNVAIKKRIIFSGGKPVITDDLTNATEDELVTDYKRVYPLGTKFSHAVGYLAKINTNSIDRVNPICPEKGVQSGGGLVGLTGLEEQYECILKGFPGEKLVEVNTLGHEIRTLALKQPTPGSDLHTSIDYGLQEELANEMESVVASKKGAAIITDGSGAILAFYSEPSYDPNLFVDDTNLKSIKALLTDLTLPLFNRVTSGTFHPGSVFKPLVALAALEEGSIDKKYTFNDAGVITVNGFSYTNWYFTEYGKTEGQIGLTKALARSTDTFFYKIGELTGPVNLAKWASMLGLDKQTGIDLPGEARGLIPTPSWKQKVKKEAWFLGNTYNMAIGQGDVSVTPVEINTYIEAIANNGLLCPPHFKLTDSSHVNCKQIDVTGANIDLIKVGMKEACTNGGTAYTFFDFSAKHAGQSVACKTGTAEVGTDGIPHAWFTVFTPSEKPKIVVTILFERGGQGSQTSGPVARKIIDYYLNRP